MHFESHVFAYGADSLESLEAIIDYVSPKFIIPMYDIGGPKIDKYCLDGSTEQQKYFMAISQLPLNSDLNGIQLLFYGPEQKTVSNHLNKFKELTGLEIIDDELTLYLNAKIEKEFFESYAGRFFC